MSDNMNSDVSSLEQLSFNYIKDNFSYYSSCCPSSENERLKKNLLFLQRVYTQQLFSELEKSKKLKKGHLDFLLNEHLRKLHILTLKEHMKEEEILEKVIPIAHNLQELSTEDPYDDYPISNQLTNPLLEKLILHSIQVKKVAVPFICDDKLLKCIASSCPNLSALDIPYSDVTGKGIRMLCSNHDGLIQARCPIKRLNLWLIPLLESDDVAFLLKNVPTLEEVIYYNLPSVIESLHLLNRKENQEPIKFNLLAVDFTNAYQSSSELTRVLTASTATCPKLKTLEIDCDNTDDLNIICRFSNLENLILSNQKWVSTNLCINDFLILMGKKLKNLTLHGFSLSVSVLVESCPNLETLILSSNIFENLDENLVKSFQLLRSLQLESFEVGASLIKLICSSPKLEKLSFINCNFDNTDTDELLKSFLNRNLSHLKFVESNVKFNFLQQLIINCRSLKSLSLSSCEEIRSSEFNLLDRFIKESNRKILTIFF